MSQVEWDDTGEAPPKKKRRVPLWVWIGCGGGCLLTAVVALVIGIFATKVVKDFKDPDKAWEKVDRLLPYDERPEGYRMVGGYDFFGTGQYIIDPPRPSVQLMVMRYPSARELETMFDPQSIQNRGVFGVNKISHAEEVGTITLQGREARSFRFDSWVPGGDDENDQPEQQDGEPRGIPTIRIDVTGRGTTPVLVQIMAHREERVSDELVTELLAPFDVWRGR